MKKYKSYFLNAYKKALVSGFFLVFLLSSCSQKNFPVNATKQNTVIATVPQYNLIANWAAHPWKKDPSDSIPFPLQSQFSGDSATDVFFIHPTTFTSKQHNSWNADIADSLLNAKTDNSTILYQASVFNAHARVFAPRYRQAHINSFFIDDSIAKPYFDIAYEDVKNAFVYYLNNYNNGKPIIIASHSQGTLHAARLLKEFFENKPLMKKLVCAYIIGLAVPDNYFSVLKPCKDASATGCFVTWRSFKSGYEGGDFITKENFKVVVINPLTWTNDSSFIASSYNKGGVLKDFNKVIPKVVSAQVHKNILWASKPNVPGKFLLIQKNYHIGDINLFYINIRENVATRISAYFEKK